MHTKIFVIFILFNAIAHSSKCNGVLRHYLNGKAYDMSVFEYKDAIYINRLDYQSFKINGKEARVTKKSEFKYQGKTIHLKNKIAKHYDELKYYLHGDHLLLRFWGKDEECHTPRKERIINMKSWKLVPEKTATDLSAHIIFDKKLFYVVDHNCGISHEIFLFDKKNDQWVTKNSEILCQNLKMRKDIAFHPAKRILIKGENGKRYKSDWQKFDKIECIPFEDKQSSKVISN